MAIPRRLIAVALSAAAAGALLYVSSKMRQAQRKSAVDETNDEKGRVADERRRAAEQRRADEERNDERPPAEAPASAQAADPRDRGGNAVPRATGAGDDHTTSSTKAGAQQELALFLAGDAWHDEVGWQALWEKEGVTSASDWLRTKGRNVLVSERQKLVEHPALLAGCRRRWIVVCRYAGIDVGDAATIWNQSETG